MIELYYPVKIAFINQGFGANGNVFYKQAGLLGHPGIDFRATHGQPVYASSDGTCYPQIDDHGGNGVLIRTAEWQVVYWHFIQDDAVVHTGQVVKAGDLIGYADNTGESTGDHLHFGLTPLINTDVNNGYHGTIDPTPYFNGKYAEDINNPPAKFQFTKTLKMGAWNNDVKQLQGVLKGVNLYSGTIDGIFGQITLQAVKAFQEAHKLTADGIVGKNTNYELNKLI